MVLLASTCQPCGFELHGHEPAFFLHHECVTFLVEVDRVKLVFVLSNFGMPALTCSAMA